jgi:hypothetical protein
MQWNTDEIDAARATLQTVNEAVDAIASKATQLESLLALFAHAASLEDLPVHHRENVYWLGSTMAAEIRAAAHALI